VESGVQDAVGSRARVRTCGRMDPRRLACCWTGSWCRDARFDQRVIMASWKRLAPIRRFHRIETGPHPFERAGTWYISAAQSAEFVAGLDMLA